MGTQSRKPMADGARRRGQVAGGAERINGETGKLTFTGQYTSIGSPACRVFLI